MNSPYPHPDNIVAIHARIVAATAEGETPDFSPKNVAEHVSAVYGELPHPEAPQIKTKDYPAYERVAWMLNDQQPTGADVTHAYETLKQSGISPAQFEATWSVARPVANRLLGQDPTMIQMQHLKDASPQDIHKYYLEHPFPGFEEVTAGQMVKAYRAAEPVARQYGYTPNHVEASRFALTNATVDDMHQHYGGS